MRKDISCVLFFTKHNNCESNKVSSILKEKLVKKGIKVVENSSLTNYFQIPEIKQEIDLAISIGGDGTALKTFRTLPPDIPVLCINAGGTRGILSEISKESATSIIDPLLNGEYFLDSRMRIVAKFGNETLSPALNDCFFVRTDLTRTPSFFFSINNDVFNQKMDGVIISTPTGSTGHTLSYEGPILMENLDCILIKPVGSVNRTPPLIISPSELNIHCTYDTKLIIDGQQIHIIPKYKQVVISRYEHNAIFLRFKKNEFRQLNKLGY